MNYYNISLNEIKAKIERRQPIFKRHKELFVQNIKEFSNNFDETLVRIDGGNISVDLKIEICCTFELNPPK